MTAEDLALLPRIPMFIGESKGLAVTLRDEDDAVVDLTGATLYFMGKSDITDADADAVLDEAVSTFLAPTTGEAVVPVDLTGLDDALKTGTATLYCDLVLKDAGGGIENYGMFIIELNKGVRDTVP